MQEVKAEAQSTMNPLQRQLEECSEEDNLFAPEDDFGAYAEDTLMGVMYRKTVLVSPTEDEYDLLLQQLQIRIDENQGETIFVVGVGENDVPGLCEEDMEASVATLRTLGETLGTDCVLLRQHPEKAGHIAEYLLRSRAQEDDFMEVRVAVVGNVDAGKSTLLGVLTHGDLDNGRGFARQKLFRHKHEKESGRTSSVGNDILGFDSCGNVVNKPEHGHLDWIKICQQASKVITFIDLAGHEKYLKTTVFGMTGHAPDFSMLMVGANAGVVGMAKEHLGLALALNVPVFVVVTKIDMCPVNVLQDTLKMLQRILKSPGCRKIPVLVQSMDDVVVSATNFTSERMCPIFQVSNVTGENLDLMKMFLNLLSTRLISDVTAPAEFQIDDTFSVPGVGTVVSGTTLRGLIRLNDTLLLGPDALGQFLPIVIKSIHRKRMPVLEVRGGQTASFSLKKIKRSQIRKGMMMLSPRLEPTACWEFEGEILVLHHPTTISVKYQAMVHVGSVRQTATIICMTKEHLRTGDKATVRFRFIKNPEYLKNDMRMVFREGRTKAVGTITHIFPHVSMAAAQNTRQNRAAKKAVESNHQLRPQNEPQKPSKRNRHRNRPYHVAAGTATEEQIKENTTAATAGTTAAVAATAVMAATQLTQVAAAGTVAATGAAS